MPLRICKLSKLKIDEGDGTVSSRDEDHGNHARIGEAANNPRPAEHDGVAFGEVLRQIKGENNQHEPNGAGDLHYVESTMPVDDAHQIGECGWEVGSAEEYPREGDEVEGNEDFGDGCQPMGLCQFCRST